MIKLTLKDGSILEVEQGTSIYEVAKKISEGLARVATCGIVNGEVQDLRHELNEDCNLSIETFESSLDGKKPTGIQRHTLWLKLLKIIPKCKICNRTKYRKWILL